MQTVCAWWKATSWMQRRWRQSHGITVTKTAMDAAWDLHTGDSEPVVRHYLATQRFVRLPGYGFSGRTFDDNSNWLSSGLQPYLYSPKGVSMQIRRESGSQGDSSPNEELRR